MKQLFKKTFLPLFIILSFGLIFSFSLPSDSFAKGNKGQKMKTEKSQKEHREKEKGKGKQSEESTAEKAAKILKGLFTDEDKRTIHGYFETNRSNLPPGLAKRESLPPGLQKHIQKNGTLPPGLQNKVQELPPDLEGRLPRLARNLKRVILGDDVLIINETTKVIMDIIKDVL